MSGPPFDWQSPYPGGPMVPVAGFPRTLQVGDPDGTDVQAYKRTVSRAGRWPWQRFDDSYSKAFAKGKAGGNVSDSGVAGVQRQQGWTPDGVVDEKTFNLLRSIRIPAGIPHAGEPAMDTTAQNLIGEAWQAFAAEHDDAAAFSTRELALEGARRWVGYEESPGNDTPFGSWYGANHQPYCAMALTYWYEVEAPGSPSFERGVRYAYCPYLYDDARAGRYGLALVSSPIAGDICLFDWDGDELADHTGIVESGGAGAFTSIEANTSPEGSGGSQSNGGGVYRRQRSSSAAASVWFVRVAE